jgi:hypothetical protein
VIDTTQPQNVEMFLAIIAGVLLVWWKLRQTIAYLAKHQPRVIFPPRPRPAPRKIEPLTDITPWGGAWRAVLSDNGLAPGAYRDDSEAAA